MEKDERIESEQSQAIKKVKRIMEEFKAKGGGSKAEVFGVAAYCMSILNPISEETEEERREYIAKIMFDQKRQRYLAGIDEK